MGGSSCVCSVAIMCYLAVLTSPLSLPTHTHLSQEKVQGLEQSLGVVVREFEEEKRRTEERHHEHLQLARWEEGGRRKKEREH